MKKYLQIRKRSVDFATFFFYSYKETYKVHAQWQNITQKKQKKVEDFIDTKIRNGSKTEG